MPRPDCRPRRTTRSGQHPPAPGRARRQATVSVAEEAERRTRPPQAGTTRLGLPREAPSAGLRRIQRWPPRGRQRRLRRLQSVGLALSSPKGRTQSIPLHLLSARDISIPMARTCRKFGSCAGLSQYSRRQPRGAEGAVRGRSVNPDYRQITERVLGPGQRPSQFLRHVESSGPTHDLTAGSAATTRKDRGRPGRSRASLVPTRPNRPPRSRSG
jgi:hypothetical protein